MPQKKIPQNLKKIIYTYLNILKKDNLPIKKVFLFGSYAKGSQHQWSDVDLCIISPKFTDYINSIQYLLSKRQLNPDYPIEPIGMTPKNFAANTPLTHEIKTTGIELFYI